MNPSDAIRALIASGLTETQIGEQVGARQSTINRIKTGDQKANYEVGLALVRAAEALAPPDPDAEPAAVQQKAA